MSAFITVLILIVCLLLALVVLVQNSKGGGLASSFSSSNQIMGVRKTADFLEKSTWSLVIALFSLCLVSTALIPKKGEAATEGLEFGDQLNEVTLPTGVPTNSLEEPPQ